MQNTALLRCDNLTLGYDRHPAVHHLTCTIERGMLLALVGPNGAGKSTLLKALSGELHPMEGSVVFERAQTPIAYLPQTNDMDIAFPVTVFDMVAMGLWPQIGMMRALTAQQRRQVHEALEQVGMAALGQRSVGHLSGGQLQKARFARMLLQNADLLLLDEPFNAVDAQTVAELMQVLLRLNAQGRTLIVSLHDLECVQRYFPQCLILAQELVALGPTDEVFSADILIRLNHFPQLDAAQAATICHRTIP